MMMPFMVILLVMMMIVVEAPLTGAHGGVGARLFISAK